MPVVSVIVPVYNAEDYLKRCVDSLVNQSLTDIEIILVDDGSRDSSGSICDNYAKKDSRVKVSHIQNGGVSNARNVGIRAASGDYLSFVDSDDWMDPDSYRLLRNEALENSADIVLCDYNEVYSTGVFPYESFKLGGSKEETIRNMITFGPRGGNIWNFIFIRRSLVIDQSLFFPGAYKRGEDFWYTLHTYVSSSRISKVNRSLYFYDLSNTSSATHNEVLVKSPVYLSFLDDCISFLKSKGYWEMLEEPMQWRVLLEKTIWVVRPRCFKCYLQIHPESNAFVSSNPLLGSKMKLLMNHLNKRHYITSALMALAYRMKTGR